MFWESESPRYHSGITGNLISVKLHIYDISKTTGRLCTELEFEQGFFPSTNDIILLVFVVQSTQIDKTASLYNIFISVLFCISGYSFKSNFRGKSHSEFQYRTRGTQQLAIQTILHVQIRLIRFHFRPIATVFHVSSGHSCIPKCKNKVIDLSTS